MTKFVFVCTQTGKSFELESSGLQIIENNGVAEDNEGNKFLDAKVALTLPCPYCGECHVYHVNELACPFS